MAETGRRDGRGCEEFRSIFMQTGLLKHAKGSSYLELGATKVMVGVFGPRQSDRKLGFSDSGRLQCEVRFTSFAGGSATQTHQSAAERNMSAALTQALAPSVLLDRLPKTVVDVYAMVLESGGGELAACITAASAALASAGLELMDLAPACQVVRVDGQLLLDPTLAEADQANGSVVLAALPATNEVTLMSVTGTWSALGSRQAVELAMGGCAQLRESMRGTLLDACATAFAAAADAVA
ncbi:ribosomal protein S5 domain 2-type protein [Haematococcus lacustris]